MTAPRTLSLLAAAWAIAFAPRAEAQVVLEASLGTAFNSPTPLVIHQAGEPDIETTAHYSTRPFVGSPYYQIQLGLWNGARTAGWVVGWLHHKIYLEDPPPEVQKFQVTYGYNTVYGGRAWLRDGLILELGGGILIANPQTEIRGKSQDRRRGFFDAGWYVAGGTIYGSVQRRVPLIGPSFLGLEAKVTTSMAWISIADGNARVPNLALHLQASLGLGP